MKTLGKITWQFSQPDRNCTCIICNGSQVEFIAHINNFQLPVCLECSKLDETELMNRMKGGLNEN